MDRLSLDTSSDSSSGTYSSDDSNHMVDRSDVDVMNIIAWNSLEGNLSNFSETFKQFSADEKTFLLKSRCLSNNCTCNFKNYDLLLARVFVGLKVLVGKWCKLRFSKGSTPDTDKIATFMFFKDFQGWYEILNENLEVIPFWNNVSQIVQNKPKSFILRKDSKCLYIKDSREDSNGPLIFENTILKGGTVLSYTQCKKYSVKKGRRVKEQYLVKCKDLRGNCFYFTPEDTLYTSPIAGVDNISGAHTFLSMIEKFHFPLNVKPIFMAPPVPNLPCSDRHFLQLTERFQIDLIVVTPVRDSNRLFLLTPSLFNDHVFTIGELLSPTVTKRPLPDDMLQIMSIHRSKLDNFFSKCHRYDSLNYLLKHAIDISKPSQKFEVVDSEFDEIYIEVEGIYFFIRNGYFPRIVASEKAKIDPSPPVITADPSSDLSQESADEDNLSADMSSTTTDSEKTSSTAMEMCKKRRLKQAKSMPLGKSRNKIENAEYNTSQSRCYLNLTVDDVVNLSMTGVCVPESSSSRKKSVDVPRFYKSHALAVPRKCKETDIEITSLKDTMV